MTEVVFRNMPKMFRKLVSKKLVTTLSTNNGVLSSVVFVMT